MEAEKSLAEKMAEDFSSLAATMKKILEQSNTAVKIHTVKIDIPPEAAELIILGQKKLLNSKEVEKLYGIKSHTLDCWRCDRKGPEFHKTGGLALYSHGQINEYLNKTRKKTSVL